MAYLIGLGAPLIVALITAINPTPAQAQSCYEGLGGAVTCTSSDGTIYNGQNNGGFITFDDPNQGYGGFGSDQWNDVIEY